MNQRSMDSASSPRRNGDAMTEYGPFLWKRSARLIGRCSRADVIVAFRAVDQEIRLKCARYDGLSITLGDACELARRIKDQRDLIRQLNDRRNRRHVRRLLRLNRKHRLRLIQLVRQAGLEVGVLVLK